MSYCCCADICLPALRARARGWTSPPWPSPWTTMCMARCASGGRLTAGMRLPLGTWWTTMPS